MSAAIRLIFVVIFCIAPLLSAHATPAKKYFAQRDDVTQFVTEMSQQHGFEAAKLAALFAQTAALPSVLQLMQPPVVMQSNSWLAYRQRFVEPKRIAAGRTFMLRYDAALTRAEASYGVPREIIAAIIGVETIYGRNKGRVNTLAALSTLAFDYPPRAELFRHELSEFLLLARDAQRDPRSYKSSYAGALGLPQFLPSSIRSYAIDFDNDGAIDIDDNATDAIGSVANFLNAHGWQTGAPIAIEVKVSGENLAEILANGVYPFFLPSTFEKLNATISIRATAAGADYFPLPQGEGPRVRVGAATPNGADDIPSLPDIPAALLDFISTNAATEYRLGYQNFYVITRYNRSRFYAAAVIDLATELKKLND